MKRQLGTFCAVILVVLALVSVVSAHEGNCVTCDSQRCTWHAFGEHQDCIEWREGCVSMGACELW